MPALSQISPVGATLTPFAYLLLLAFVLLALSVMVGTLLRDARRAQTEPVNVVLARRAAQLRTRELDAHRTYMRVVPVLQRGELARPIIVPDWRR